MRDIILDLLTVLENPNVEMNGIVVGGTVIVVVTVQTFSIVLMTVSLLVKLPCAIEARAPSKPKMHRCLILAVIAPE
jgi:hypothetical protein